MNNHPEGKEELAEKRSPGLITTINGVRYSGDDSDKVYDQKGCGGYQECGPFEHVQLCEISILVGRLGSDSEVRVNASENFENTLKYGKKMGRDTTDDPKLFIPPPFINANTTPSHLQDAGGEDGEEERDEPKTREVADLY